MRTEILILGGSLAGLSCAIALKKLGYEPVVLEKCHFPRPKLCGEFLGPDALVALKELNLLDTVQKAAYGPIERTYFYNRRGQSVQIQHHWIDPRMPYGLAIPRDCLDSLLMAEAKTLGVMVLEGYRALSPIRRERSSSGEVFCVKACASETGKPLRELDIQAQWLVDATGRSGKLTLASPEKLPSTDSRDIDPKAQKIGIQCHVRLPHPLATKDLHMFLFKGGYGGIQPISDGLANICMLFDAHLGKKMPGPFSDFLAATIGENPAATAYLGDCKKEGDFNTTADVNLAGETGQWNLWRSDALLRIGDACVTVDPFTGSGMAHALETGQLAAQCLHEAWRNYRSYGDMLRHYQSSYQKRFKTRLRAMRFFRPFLESEPVQAWIWPVLPVFLPGLARGLR